MLENFVYLFSFVAYDISWQNVKKQNERRTHMCLTFLVDLFKHHIMAHTKTTDKGAKISISKDKAV